MIAEQAGIAEPLLLHRDQRLRAGGHSLRDIPNVPRSD
jgi:hypothetical protein